MRLHDEILGADHQFLWIKGKFWIQMLDDKSSGLFDFFWIFREVRFYREMIYRVYIRKSTKGYQIAQDKILSVKPRNLIQRAVVLYIFAARDDLRNPRLRPLDETIRQIRSEGKVGIVLVVAHASQRVAGHVRHVGVSVAAPLELIRGVPTDATPTGGSVAKERIVGMVAAHATAWFAVQGIVVGCHCVCDYYIGYGCCCLS
mmetsp:Transcript_17849/g.44520  ORF Transcript_17849/g.44520 Transcript_17849/m.44520 type:complete len:202 (-) Transcript_17849:299-904(-)